VRQGTLRGSITVRLTSCLTGLDMCLCTTRTEFCTAQMYISKPILPPYSVPCLGHRTKLSNRFKLGNNHSKSNSWQRLQEALHKGSKLVKSVPCIQPFLPRSREHLRGRLTSCLTGLELYICAVQNSVHTTQRHISKPVKQEVNLTVILPPQAFPALMLK